MSQQFGGYNSPIGSINAGNQGMMMNQGMMQMQPQSQVPQAQQQPQAVQVQGMNPVAHQQQMIPSGNNPTPLQSQLIPQNQNTSEFHSIHNHNKVQALLFQLFLT